MSAIPKTKIVLVGLSGTGKSTLAPMLAERWRFEYLDTDAEVEARMNMIVSEIFAQKGEPFFREQEARVVFDAMEYPRPLVVSTGGGAPLREDSRAVMKERAVVVWLAASVETLAERIANDPSTPYLRPAYADLAKARERVACQLAEREAIYRDVATMIVDTDGKTFDELVVEIADEAPNYFF